VIAGTEDDAIGVDPTDCAEGLISATGLTVGAAGAFFVSQDAVRVTGGGQSKVLSDAIRPLFNGETVNGYFPIDFTQARKIRLMIYGDDLWFGFQDTNGSRVWWIYSIIYNAWRFHQFAVPIGMAYEVQTTAETRKLILGGVSSGKAYLHQGTTDDGGGINVLVRSGALFAGNREEKIFGDLLVWGDLRSKVMTAQTFLNGEATTNPPTDINTSSGYNRYLYEPFGVVPQHAQSLSVQLSWLGSDTPTPYISQVGVSTAIQPEITMKRATTWQPVAPNGEGFVYGCWIDSDTGGVNQYVDVEGLLNGQPVTLASLLINSNHGRREWFSWPYKHVDMIRIRPTVDCGPWMLFGQGWLVRPEPPRIAGWETGFENHEDSYYTGLDIECDTFGVNKQVQVMVDNVLLSDPATALPYWTINANGRSYKHLTLPWGRGHIYRAFSTDANLGLMYTHKWILDEEPGEQANWNQNFTIAGTHADKWIKGILLECDTFGVSKSVNVEVDGVAVPSGPFVVNTVGRKVVQISFPQVLGRVFRIFPADNNPSRLYTLGWIFDEEPFCLTRFETQEGRFGIDDWKIENYGQVTYKSTGPVTLTSFIYGMDGQLLRNYVYTLPSTGGVKAIHPYKPFANRGLLYKYTVTAAAGFWLYREESWIELQAWQGGQTVKIKPFGNDDLDETRIMTDSVGAASRAGGTANMRKALGVS
jgi:hypothetical protein